MGSAEDAGQSLSGGVGAPIGVFIGVSTHDFGDLIAGSANRSGVGAHTATGTALSITANRISHAFDLRGPSIAIDTACSSSLTAVHLGCRSLMQGECDVALAGGVNLFLSPDSALGLAKASMLSPDGECRAFDAHANGFVRGEGVGVVVLRPLSAALADRDRIYAVICASAVNQDGKLAGITVPRAEAQEALFRKALDAAGIAPSAVGYLEAHGTGTIVGDPIEARAIGRVFSAGRDAGLPLQIGSVKTNIGHLEAAAGIAGLIKTALVLWHRAIPANLHFTEPNPAIPFAALRLAVPVVRQVWPDSIDTAIAGVNSFGFGGANAHVLLQEAPRRAPDALKGDRDVERLRILVLSASAPAALHSRAHDMTAVLGEESADLDDVCYTATARRTHLEHRLAVVGRSRAEILAGLDAFGRGAASPDVIAGRAPAGRPKLVMVFSGMGPRLASSGAELFDREPVFRAVIRAVRRGP